jgi:outer membrane protein OmpA-like peptidoglycan-associated protein
LTTTKKKYHRTMLHKLRVFLPLLCLPLLVPACVETYQDAVERARYQSEYGVPELPTREQFVGSIYFATGSSQLSRSAAADLARMAERIRERRHAGLRVVLVGYADRRRGVEENSELAAERAQKVAIALEKQGIDFERILLDSRPVRLSKAKVGERRVDIYLEQRSVTSSSTLYPILVAFFLLTTFIVAVLVFRRRR